MSRQAWYKHEKEAEKEAFEASILLGDIRKLRLKLPGAGVEKLHFVLQDRGIYRRWNIKMGRDKLAGLLRQSGLLLKRKRRGKRTTNSCHSYQRHPNLIKNMAITAKNQVWVSDITYLPVGSAYNYLSLVTDAHSRKIVGWHLGRNLDAEGSVKALQMAIEHNARSLEGLVHHSDRGSQYCCHKYARLLKEHKIRTSMAENGDPYENALAERMNRTIKEEMLQSMGFCNHQAALEATAKAIADYNEERPHASLDFQTPADVHKRNQANLKKRWSKRNQTTTKPDAAAGGEPQEPEPENANIS